MFWPAEISPWMYGMLGFTALMIFISVFFLDWDEALILPLGLGGMSGLIGGMMAYHMRKWVRWSWNQRLKSSAQLEEEALSHPVQPRYEDDGCFADWAGQFLPEKDVDALIEKYQSQPNSE